MKSRRCAARYALWGSCVLLLLAGLYRAGAAGAVPETGAAAKMMPDAAAVAGPDAAAVAGPDAAAVAGPDAAAVLAPSGGAVPAPDVGTSAGPQAVAVPRASTGASSRAGGAGPGTPPAGDGEPSAAYRLGASRPDELDTPWYQRVTSGIGLLILVTLAWLLSTDRRIVHWRVLLWGIALQLVFAVFILKTPAGERLFAGLNEIIVALLGFTVEGAGFLFGNLVWGNVPVGQGEPGPDPAFSDMPGMVARTGAFFAFNVLPTIIFFSSLMTVLYHLRIMQAIVRGMAWVMMRTMRTSGAETLSAAGNVFVGQTEAPLLVKPFVARMTMSELMAVMTGGFATVAGGVMAAYVGLMIAFFPGIAGHLIAASVMSAPAALAIAKLMYPEREDPVTRGGMKVELETEPEYANVIDAAARGAGLGLNLALNVGAMLLAFIALIALVNAVVGLLGDTLGLTAALQGRGWLAPDAPLTFEMLLGWLLAPVAFIMGVPWQDAVQVGTLLGVKTVLNEFVAFLQLSSLLAEGAELSPRSVLIATYALAGFANFASIAIQIGGIGGIAPDRRSDLARLGLRAMIGGTIAAFTTATIAGMLV